MIQWKYAYIVNCGESPIEEYLARVEPEVEPESATPHAIS